MNHYSEHYEKSKENIINFHQIIETISKNIIPITIIIIIILLIIVIIQLKKIIKMKKEK